MTLFKTKLINLPVVVKRTRKRMTTEIEKLFIFALVQKIKLILCVYIEEI